jgi:pimeloyl-ACP methyl ester carboxylesterase
LSFEPNSSIRLPDGRLLAFAEHGAPGGRPLLYFHGTPGSRLEHHPHAQIAAGLGVRVICVERPGYGVTDPKPGRRLIDWPADVAAMADALALGGFAVCGWSGGGPYALACAHRLPERVTAVALFSSVAELVQPGAMDGWPSRRRIMTRLTRALPWSVARLLLGPPALTAWLPAEQGFERYLHSLSADERAELGSAGLREVFVPSIREAFKQGFEGYAVDMRLLIDSWGFDPAEIRPPVYGWFGTMDTQTPASMGRALERMLPQLRLRWCEGEGHGLWVRHWKEMIETLFG